MVSIRFALNLKVFVLPLRKEIGGGSSFPSGPFRNISAPNLGGVNFATTGQQSIAIPMDNNRKYSKNVQILS